MKEILDGINERDYSEGMNLIPIDSDLYGKRLARAIRANFEHGVYVDGSVTGQEINHRIQSVNFSNGELVLQCRNDRVFRVNRYQWNGAFYDGYGRDICVCRS